MNNAIDIFELATVDLVDLLSIDPERAKEHAINILSNHDVAETRIKFLQQLQPEGAIREHDDWADELNKFRECDLVELIMGEQIPFSRIIEICSSPSGIASGFNASLEQFENEDEEIARDDGHSLEFDASDFAPWNPSGPFVEEFELVGGGVGFEFGDNVDPFELPEGKNAGLCNNGTGFKLNFPVRSSEYPDAPEFPFGCAIVELRDFNTNVVSRQLIPVREHNSRNLGDLSMDELWPTGRTKNHEIGWSPLQPEMIGMLCESKGGRDWLKVQLELILMRPLVRYDDPLKTKVKSALNQILD